LARAVCGLRYGGGVGSFRDAKACLDRVRSGAEESDSSHHAGRLWHAMFLAQHECQDHYNSVNVPSVDDESKYLCSSSELGDLIVGPRNNRT
jgi:hypothetical protein